MRSPRGRGARLALSAATVGWWALACTTPPAGERTEPGSGTREGSLAAASSVVDSLLRGGDSIYRQSADSARTLWAKALDAAQRAGDSTGVARALTGLGQAARVLGDLATSRRLGEEALDLKRALGLRGDYFRSFNALGLLAWDEGRLADASGLLDDAESAARETNDSVALAKVTLNRGLVLQDLGAFAEAREAFDRSRVASGAVGDSATMAKAYNNIAALDVLLGEPLAALAGLEVARRLAGVTGDSATEVNARGQMAAAYRALGEPQRAFAILDSAVRMAQRDGRRLEAAEDLKLLGDLFEESGDARTAIDQYARAAALADSLGLVELRANIGRREAGALASLGNMSAARQRGREALRLHRSTGHPWPALLDRLVLAELAARAGDRAEADAELRAAEALADTLGVPVARARVSLADAYVAAERGEWGRVLQALDRTRGVPEFSDGGAEAEVMALRARAYAARGDLEAAAAAGRRAVAAVERVRGNYASGALRTTFVARQSAIYADQSLLLLRMGRTEESFAVADAARGRALMEHLLSARSNVPASGGARTLLERERLLRRIDALMARLQARAPVDPRERSPAYTLASAGLVDSIRQARSEYEAILAREGRQPLPALALLGGATARVPDIAETLASDEAVLEYLVTPDRLLVFVISPKGLQVHELAVESAGLEARVRLARALLQDPAQSDRATAVLRALHEQLVAPIAAAGALRGVRRLVVVPHAFLTYLPFAALLDARSGRYLVEDYVLTHAPTAAAIAALRAPGRLATGERQRQLPVVAFAPFPSELQATRDEVLGIASTVAETSTRIGPSATEREVRAALASRAVVHLATHARMNARNPLFSRVDLAGAGAETGDDNARLEVHELLPLALSNPLVFLSGCETALGGAWDTGIDSGEDYTTIAQVFLYAGVRAVVATLWRIDDAGAGTFARRFYADGGWRGDAAAALAAAQRAMRADPRYGSPYYWAPYQLSGGGAPPRKASPTVRFTNPPGDTTRIHALARHPFGGTGSQS